MIRNMVKITSVPVLVTCMFFSAMAAASELHDAANRNDINSVKTLIKSGAELNVKDETGDAALHRAVRAGRYDMVFELVTNGAAIDIRNKSGETPLIISVKMDNTSIAQLLIANGASVIAKDNLLRTPLHDVESRRMAELLITNGADPIIKDIYGETPIDRLKHANHPDICEYLLAVNQPVELPPQPSGTAVMPSPPMRVELKPGELKCGKYCFPYIGTYTAVLKEIRKNVPEDISYELSDIKGSSGGLVIAYCIRSNERINPGIYNITVTYHLSDPLSGLKVTRDLEICILVDACQ
ncbi:ankyrin repeat domain-containing protein [bacterium]|nr:ankyrin repeat domain-containing protein [candidate division CSSED10-310 bacterium]